MSSENQELPGMMALANGVQKGEWPHTMDAQVWATKWLEITKDKPEIATDEGAMIGWFANAIMAGYDSAMLRSNYQADGSKVCRDAAEWIGQAAALLQSRDATIEGLRAELAEAREILAGGNFGSLPNDWTLPRVAASVMEDMHKLTWQVRDTCARAETAEAALAARQGG